MNDFVTRILSILGGRGKEAAQDAPPVPVNRAAQAMPGGVAPFMSEGVVVQSLQALNQLIVRVSGRETMTCTPLSTVGSGNGSFLETTALPAEGTVVLVLAQSPESAVGYVLGAVPARRLGATGTSAAAMLTPEPGISTTDLESHTAPDRSSAARGRLGASVGVGIDTVPGEMVVHGRNGGSAHMGNLSMGFGYQDAGVNMYRLDSLLDVAAANYRMRHAAGSTSLYDDEGKITLEMRGSHVTPEVRGTTEYGAKTMDVNAEPTSDSAGLRNTESELLQKTRYQMHLGHAGGVMNFMVSVPNKGTETAATAKPDAGVLHAHAGLDGTFCVIAAGNMHLANTRVIPVPKRIKEAFDPEGDKHTAPSEKNAWKPASSVAGIVALQSRDARIYDQLKALSRYSDAKKDWLLAPAAESPTPPDHYDTSDGSQGRADFWRDKEATGAVSMLSNGAVILEGTGGAQIVLSDGQILLSAPKGVRIVSGGAIEALAGTDVVLRAEKSLDAQAARGDIRLSAEKNMQMVSRTAGVLVESMAKTDVQEHVPGGEQARTSGIVLKAADSMIFSQAKNQHLAAKDRLTLEALPTGGASQVRIVARDIAAVASSTLDAVVRSAASSVSGLTISGGAAQLGGKSATVVSESTTIINGNQAHNPELENVGPSALAALQQQLNGTWRETPCDNKGKWLPDTITLKAREGIGFTYRDVAEYDLQVPICSPAWYWRSGDKHNKTAFEPIRETYPFPGKGTMLFGVEKELNLDTKTGTPVEYDKADHNGANARVVFKQWSDAWPGPKTGST